MASKKNYSRKNMKIVDYDIDNDIDDDSDDENERLALIITNNGIKETSVFIHSYKFDDGMHYDFALPLDYSHIVYKQFIKYNDNYYCILLDDCDISDSYENGGNKLCKKIFGIDEITDVYAVKIDEYFYDNKCEPKVNYLEHSYDMTDEEINYFKSFSRHIELNTHSCFNYREGVLSPAEIVGFAENDGADAVAITDLNSVSAFPDFDFATKRTKGSVKGIYGVRLWMGDSDSDVTLITLLAKNRTGLMNLYKLVSISHSLKMQITKKDLIANREGLLVGRELSWEELYAWRDKNMDELSRIITSLYQDLDYAELRPWSQNPYKEECASSNTEKLLTASACATLILTLNGILPVAVSNANCLSDQDELCWDMFHCDGTVPGYSRKVRMQSTEAILDDYAYLENAREIVVLDNPRRIADAIEDIDPSAIKPDPIKIPNAEKMVRELCQEKAKEIYGTPVSDSVRTSLEKEMKLVGLPANWSYLLLAYELSKCCREHGYHYIIRGCAGDSLIAYLLGITANDPLRSQHYYPEFLFGIDGDKQLSLEMNIAPEMRPELMKCLDRIFGGENVFFQGEFFPFGRGKAETLMDHYQYLGNVIPKEMNLEKLRFNLSQVSNGMMEDASAVVIIGKEDDIFRYTPVEDIGGGNRPQTLLSGFCGMHFPKIRLHGDTRLSMLKKLEDTTKVKTNAINIEESWQKPEYQGKGLNCFKDFVRRYGFAHGSFTWLSRIDEEQPELIVYPESTFVFREDVMRELLGYGISRRDAYDIAEYVRKGKAESKDFTDAQLALMKEYGVPDDMLDEMREIRYLFSWPHAEGFTLLDLWLEWYQNHYPEEYKRVDEDEKQK